MRRDNTPWSELKQVANHGGASRATLEPNEKWGFGVRGSGGLSFIEGIKNSRTSGVVDRKVARFGGEGVFGEERSC